MTAVPAVQAAAWAVRSERDTERESTHSGGEPVSLRFPFLAH